MLTPKMLFVCGAKQARDDQQRVARQEEPDQQAGLGEDDEADDEQRPRAGRPR